MKISCFLCLTLQNLVMRFTCIYFNSPQSLRDQKLNLIISKYNKRKRNTALLQFPDSKKSDQNIKFKMYGILLESLMVKLN